jgi:hypothetical protein
MHGQRFHVFQKNVDLANREFQLSVLQETAQHVLHCQNNSTPHEQIDTDNFASTVVTAVRELTYTPSPAHIIKVLQQYLDTSNTMEFCDQLMQVSLFTFTIECLNT